MTEQREILKAQRAKFEEQVRGLKSYVQELMEVAAKHGTDAEHYEEELSKARGDLAYYEGQVGHIAAELGDSAARRTFKVYKDAGGEWRWRLVAGNDRIIADSGEGYRDKSDCLHAIELVKESREAQVEGAD
jgi:uncharacterized protein YegP (UPF0339 family)